MDESPIASQTFELATIWEDFLRLQPRLKTVLPADLAHLKERLGKLHPEGGSKRASDYDLFYRIGVILSRQRDPMTMGKLSEALAVPLSTATRMIDWMVESGYVERVPDPDDRRVVRVALSKTGKDLYQTINRFIRQHVEEILREFTPREREDLVVLLRKLLVALEHLIE